MASGYVVGTPPQTPVLRPLRQSLHDSEEFANAQTATNNFFVRRSTFNAGGAKVFPIDTNMTQDGRLGTPLEFDLIGFNFEFVRGVAATRLTSDEIKDIYSKAGFTWIFGSTVVWLQTRLTQVPTGMGESGAIAHTLNNTERLLFSNGNPSAKNVYSIVDPGKQARRVTSNESFRAEIPLRAALVLTNTQVGTVYMRGVLYTNM